MPVVGWVVGFKEGIKYELKSSTLWLFLLDWVQFWSDIGSLKFKIRMIKSHLQFQKPYGNYVVSQTLFYIFGICSSAS